MSERVLLVDDEEEFVDGGRSLKLVVHRIEEQRVDAHSGGDQGDAEKSVLN